MKHKLPYSFLHGFGWAVLLVISSIEYTLFEVSFSEELGNSLDVANSGSIASYRDYLVRVIVVVVLFLSIRILYSMIENRYLKTVLYRMRSEAFRSISAKKYSRFNEYGAAGWKAFLVSDLQLLEDHYVVPVVHAVTDGITLLITLAALLRINVIATIFVLAASCVPLLLSRCLITPVQKQFGAYSKYMGDYTLHLSDYLEGFEEFTDYHAQEFVRALHAQRADVLEQKKKKAYLQLDLMSNAIAISSVAVTIGILLVGMFLALHGKLTVGQVFAISFISNGVSTPLSNLSDYIPKILSVKEVVDKYNLLVCPEKKEPWLGELKKGIDIQNVSLTIGEKCVLDHVSFRFSLGKKYALVGESGSGKSTLLKLMMGYYDHYEGNILYDAVDSRTVDSDSLYHYISYVPQKGVLLNATVRDNLTLFDEQTEDRAVLEMISQTGLTQRLDAYESVLDHVLSDAGENFSGGERQRLALGRAFLAKKDLLFLDEATSALDHESYLDMEKVILEKEASMIVSVQHRLEKNVMENYDVILVMRNGEIVESGSWEHLTAKKGYFYSLVQAQTVSLESSERG